MIKNQTFRMQDLDYYIANEAFAYQQTHILLKYILR
jgi:ABC-type microcin C transport system permease subunit YejE